MCWCQFLLYPEKTKLNCRAGYRVTKAKLLRKKGGAGYCEQAKCHKCLWAPWIRHNLHSFAGKCFINKDCTTHKIICLALRSSSIMKCDHSVWSTRTHTSKIRRRKRRPPRDIIPSPRSAFKLSAASTGHRFAFAIFCNSFVGFC